MEREEINKHYTTVNCFGEIKSCYIRPVWDAKGRERAYDALTREIETFCIFYFKTHQRSFSAAKRRPKEMKGGTKIINFDNRKRDSWSVSFVQSFYWSEL